MGTEAFWVPAVLAAVSAGGQAVNTAQAQNRANNSEISSIQQQQQLESQAANQATQLTRQIAQNNPQKIQGQETNAFVNNLRKNQAATSGSGGTSFNPTSGAGSSLSPVVGGSKRYSSDVGASQQAGEQYGNSTATDMAAIDGAVRQRQNEGLAMSGLSTNLNLMGAQSSALQFVNQLRTNAAGQADPWVNLAANLVGNAGTSLSKNTPSWLSNGSSGAGITNGGGIGGQSWESLASAGQGPDN
jgi:hypothetical protein